MSTTTRHPETTAPEVRHCVGRRLAHFLRQLRERKVCRAAAAYALVAWLILQLGEIIFPALDLPDWSLSLVVVLAAIGFPFAMLLAWLLQWTEDGLIIDLPAGKASSASSSVDKGIDATLLIVTALLSMQLVWARSVPDELSTVTVQASQPTALSVLPFSIRAAGEFESAHGLEDEIRHQLLQRAPGLPVFASISRNEAFESGQADVRWALEGTVYIVDQNVRMLLQLIDLSSRRYVWSLSLNHDDAAAPDTQALAGRAVSALLDENAMAFNLSAMPDPLVMAYGPHAQDIDFYAMDDKGDEL